MATTERVSITLGVDTLALAREAAEQAEMSLSAWLDKLAAAEVRRAGGEAMGDLLRTPEGVDLRDFMRAASDHRARVAAQLDAGPAAA